MQPVDPADKPCRRHLITADKSEVVRGLVRTYGREGLRLEVTAMNTHGSFTDVMQRTFTNPHKHDVTSRTNKNIFSRLNARAAQNDATEQRNKLLGSFSSAEIFSQPPLTPKVKKNINPYCGPGTYAAGQSLLMVL